jgi:hypothetical protein
MQIGGIIAIVIAATVSAAAIVSLGLGLGIGLGTRKPCGVAKIEQSVTPSVDYICFDNNYSQQVLLQLSGSGLMQIGQTPPTISVFAAGAAATVAVNPQASLPNSCAYSGTCTVSSVIDNTLFGSANNILNLTAYVDNPTPCNTASDQQLTSYAAVNMNSMSYTAVYLKVSDISPAQPLPVSTIFTTGFGSTITVSGSGFIATQSNGIWQYPTVELTAIGTGITVTAPVYSVDQCTLISNQANVYSCNVFTLQVYGNEQASKGDPNSFTLDNSWYNKDLYVSVDNNVKNQMTNCTASTADDTTVDNSKRIFLFEAPEITSVVPNTICALNNTQLNITGFQFVTRQNSDNNWDTPTLWIGNVSVTVTKDMMSQCSNMIASSSDSGLYPADATLQVCSQISVILPPNTFPMNQSGDLPLSINNPTPFSAPTVSQNLLTISSSYCPPPYMPPNSTCPVIDSYEVVPTEGHLTFCASPLSNAKQSIIITGNNFRPTSSVSLMYTSSNNSSNSSFVLVADKITFTDSHQLIADFHRNVPAGNYTLNITNVNDPLCNSSASSNFTIPIYPIRWMVYTNPTVVSQGVNSPVDVFTLGFTTDSYLLALMMQEYSDGLFGDAISVPFSVISGSKVTITVPNTVDNGEYQVIMVATDGCGTQPLGPNLIVSNQTNISLKTATPSSVLSNTNTAISLYLNSPLLAGKESLAKSARVYLTKQGAPTVQLTGISVAADGMSLRAVVPQNTDAGVYDIVVVNPSGAVGTGSEFITVLSSSSAVQPQVYAITPSSGSTSITATITGANFEQDTTVSASCQQPDGTTVSYNVPVSSSTSTTLTVAFPFNAPQSNSICNVIVTNPSSGLSFTYSQVVTTDELSQFSQAPSLSEPRRKMALVGARLSSLPYQSGQMYLYAIDGDHWGSTSSMNSVEIGAISTPVTSNTGITWTTQSNIMPGIDGLSHHDGVRIGNMIYIVGGIARTTTDGESVTNTVNTVYRAVILDPNATPTISQSSSAVLSDATGLGEGTWYYAVSAVYAADNEINPNGESLPSDILSIQLPPIYPGMSVSFEWDAIPSAAGYNIYRTIGPDLQPSSLVLLDTVTNTSYVDNGNKVPAQNASHPLTQGSLGNWALLSVTMNKNREQLGVTAASLSDTQNFLYAVGGFDETSTALDTYEFLPVTITPAAQAKDYETHTLGAWTLGSSNLPGTKAQASVTTDGDRVYIGPGQNENNVYYGQVSSNGDLGTLSTIQHQPSGDNHDSCFVAASGNLYVIGLTTQVLNCTESSCDGTWTARNALATPRTAAGCTKEGTMMFIAGGATDSEVVSTVEYALI